MGGKQAAGIVLRRAQRDDAPVMARVHVDSWRAAYRGIVPDDFLENFTYPKREAAWREGLENRTEETYIAEEGGKAIGILTLGAGRDDDLDHAVSGEIWGIYLLPDHWRRGMGTILVKEAEKMLRSRGYRTIVLWVLAENTAARKFYEAMGYAADGKERTLLLGKELTAVRYSRALPDR